MRNYLSILAFLVACLGINTTMAEEDYDEYFSPIAGAMESFSGQHNLLVQKYYHDAPVWSLCFNHPNGGQAKIDISKEENGKLAVQGIWWEDNYDTFTRHIMCGEKVEVMKEGKAVSELLQNLLPKLIEMPKGSWTNSYPDYKDIWSRYSKSEFEAMTPKWPSPSL